MRKAFITGGAGYIGSHTSKVFAKAGWDVTIFDNLSRGHAGAARFGRLVVGDILDPDAIGRAIADAAPDVVLHFAAFAYVGESVGRPEIYYRNNVTGTINLIDAMDSAGASRLIFSSSCATYGHPRMLPIDESHPQSPINPYGWSKMMCERIIIDHCAAHALDSVILRYFNAAGCDPDGDIGEDHDPETHVIPLAIEAALDGAGQFAVNGTDFDTPDGSAVRDFIHVTDLAEAHLLAAEYLCDAGGTHIFNIGTGSGISVREIVRAVEGAVGKPMNVRLADRRVGDPASLVAAADKANAVLGWRPTRSGIETIVETALDWQRSAAARADRHKAL